MFVLLVSLALSIASPPVPGPITQRFVAPACQRCAGHRGVTIDNPEGQSAVAPLSGTVTFAGTVARRLYVVVQPWPGVLVTVGWLESLAVAQNDVVQQGHILGVAGESTYLGVRLAGKYVEPLTFLGLGGPRLVAGGGIREAVVGLRPLPR